jgi:hypothetical protein
VCGGREGYAEGERGMWRERGIFLSTEIQTLGHTLHCCTVMHSLGPHYLSVFRE